MPDPNPDLKEGTRVVIETKAALPASCRQTLTLDSGKGTLATSSVVELNSLTTDCTEGAFGP